ncbi:MAG: class I SAM-dependent methyltransferase [Methylovulum sp.]|nr:class I SAM-dependent methyltransferase [Methylovulum sp.]
MPKPPPIDLNEITQQTIAHYEHHAQSFWEGTKDHDVSQNIGAFLGACQPDKVLDILDFGCGPGRDLLHFKSVGHRPVGLDGSAAFCQMAAELTGCPVLRQNFLALDLPAQAFDGIYANASLFHVPRQHLPAVLDRLHRALRPEGILFTSNPRGNGETVQGRRYGNYMELESSARFLAAANFEMLRHYYRPEGLPRGQQLWLAIVSKRKEQGLG